MVVQRTCSVVHFGCVNSFFHIGRRRELHPPYRRFAAAPPTPPPTHTPRPPVPPCHPISDLFSLSARDTHTISGWFRFLVHAAPQQLLFYPRARQGYHPEKTIEQPDFPIMWGCLIFIFYLPQKLCFWTGIIFIGVYVFVCLSVNLYIDYLKKSLNSKKVRSGMCSTEHTKF